MVLVERIAARYEQIEHLFRLERPDHLDCLAELLVGLVHFLSCNIAFVVSIGYGFARSNLGPISENHSVKWPRSAAIGASPTLTGAHFDVQIFADQCKQCGGEGDLFVLVQRHVHPYELLVGEAIRTFVTKTQRRIDIF